MVFENIKHTAKDYGIYIFTLILLVCIFYGFMSIASLHFQKFFPDIYNVYQLQQIVKNIIPIITLLIIFLINYVNQYILTKKQQEFALLKLMGMESIKVGLIFFAQTFITGFIAIILGCILGMFFSQVVAAIVLYLCSQPLIVYLTLFPDTVFITVSVFSLIFLLVGIVNIWTISKMRIIDMLKKNKKGEIKLSLNSNFIEIITGFLISIYTFIYGCLGIFEAFKQGFYLNIKIWIFINTFVSCIFILILCIYFWKLYKKYNISLILNFLVGLIEIILGVCTFVLFAYLHVTDLYLIVGIIFIILGIRALFNCLSSFILKIQKCFQKFYYKNLFLFGQLTFKLKTNSRTMSVLTFVISSALIILSMAQPIAYTKSEYQKTRLKTEIVIKTDWFDCNVIEELPKSDLSFGFVEDYLKKAGYKIQNSIAIPYYFIDNNDFEKHDNKEARSKVILGVSLQDYNFFRQIMGLSKVYLDYDEFAIHWPREVTDDAKESFNKILNTKSITLQFSGYSDSDYMGELFENNYNYTVILPNSVCDYLTVAQFRYFCNTTSPLSYKFATQFSRDMAEKIDTNNIFKLGKGLSNIRTKTDQINEGFMWQIVLTLVFTYIGAVLVIMSFTILSLQQLIDSTEHKLRFEILLKMGIKSKEIHLLVFQQMLFWFGVPLIFAILISSTACFQLYNLGFLEMSFFISKSSFNVKIFSSILMTLLLLCCYFIITYELFIRNVESKK